MLILNGVSKKGKSRVKQFGKKWIILGEHTSSEKLLIQSNDSDAQGSTDMRWILMSDDPDFFIEENNID